MVGRTDAVAAIGRKHAYGHDVQLAASLRFALQAACYCAHNHVVMVRCNHSIGECHVLETFETLSLTLGLLIREGP